MHFTRVLLSACAVFSTATAYNYSITVGQMENGLPAFAPHYLSVKTGDYFTFNFSSTNIKYKIYRSQIEDPCKADLINGSQYAINETLTYLVTENISTGPPVWYFDSVGSNCKNGMIFGLNLGASPAVSFDERKAKAALSNATMSPPYGYAQYGSGMKMSIQRMAVLAGVVVLVGLLM